jgi:hypothetical protein
MFNLNFSRQTHRRLSDGDFGGCLLDLFPFLVSGKTRILLFYNFVYSFDVSSTRYEKA